MRPNTVTESLPYRVTESQRLGPRRWRNNDGTWTLLETAFTSYFLRKVSWFLLGKSYLAIFTFVW